MTKQLRKGLMTVLLFVMAIVCAFSVTTALADSAALTKDEAQFVADVNAFVTAADANADGAIDEAEVRALVGTEVNDTLFLSARAHALNGGSTSNDADYLKAKANYGIILEAYNKNKVDAEGNKGAVDVYSEVNYNSRALYKDKKTSYKDHKAVEALTKLYADVTDTADMAFITNAFKYAKDWNETESYPANLKLAEDLIQEELDKIEAAIKAINEIKVSVDNAALANVWTGAAYSDITADNVRVVIESNGSVEDAILAVANVTPADLKYITGTDLITDENTAINHNQVLENAKAELQAQYDKVQAVVDYILEVYGAKKAEPAREKTFKVNGTGAVVYCYTIKADILEASDKFEALYGGSDNPLVTAGDLNNLYEFLKAEKTDAYNKLNEMLDALAAVEAEIEDVKDLIDAIPTPPSYTNAYNQAVVAARGDANTGFESLPEDVQAFYEANGSDTLLTNYEKLIEAEEQWAEYGLQITALVEDINALIEIDQKGDATAKLTFYAKYSDALAKYNGLDDKNNQLETTETGLSNVFGTALDAGLVFDDGRIKVKTCGDAWSYVSTLAEAIVQATSSIDNNIKALALMDIKFTDAFDALFVSIIDAIESEIPVVTQNGVTIDEVMYDARYIGSILNYAIFDNEDASNLGIKQQYLAKLALAEAWIDTVVEIGEVTVANLDEVVAAENAYKTLNDAYGFNTLATDLAIFNRKYTPAAASEDTFANFYDTYVDAVAARDALIKAMNDLKDAIEALDRPAVAGDYTTYADDVAAATALYNALADDTKVYFQTNENYADAYVKYVTALINVKANAIEALIIKIEALKDDSENYIYEARVAYDGAAGLNTVYTAQNVKDAVRNYDDLTEVEEKLQAWEDAIEALLVGAAFDGSDVLASAVVVTASNANNIQNGFYKLNIDDAVALINEGRNFSNVEIKYVAGNYDINAAGMLLGKMLEIAGVNTFVSPVVLGSKLDYIDAQLGDYCHKYAIGQAEEGQYEILEALESALTLSQKSYLKNIEAFQQIARDKAMADELAAAIISLYNNTIVDGEITADTVVNYYVISSIYASLNDSQQALVITADEINKTAVEALAAIKAKMGDTVEYDLTAILGRINALEGTYTDDQIDAAIDAAKTAVLNDAKAYADGIVANLATGAVKTNADAIAANLADIEALEALVAGLPADKTINQAIEAAKAAAIEAAKAYADDIKSDLQDLISALENGKVAANAAAIAKEITDRAAEIARLEGVMATDEELAAAKAAIKEVTDALDAAIKAEAEARENADKAEAAARDEADKAIKTDLENAVAALNSTITTITIILGVVSLALAGCIVFIFLKKRA